MGTRRFYRCPFCKGSANATYKCGRDGSPRWMIGCWSPSCSRGGEYLAALGDALGLGLGATPDEIADALKGYGHGSVRRGEAEPPPSLAKVEGWAARLLAEPHSLRYLTETRGVALDVLRANRIGWDGRRLTFPMFRDGTLVAVKTRLPRAGAQMRSPRGERGWPLYPEVEPGDGPVILTGGELDALAAISAGLAAVSVTCGAGYWRDDWTDALSGRQVVVCFDNNEVEQARAVTFRLRDAGISARRLDLWRLGLATPKGDLSNYLNAGGDPARLLRRPLIVRRSHEIR